MGERRKTSGRYCWSCGYRHPNEQFSKRGQARCLCRKCIKLDEAELAYRQALKDIDRLLGWSGVIGRRVRPILESYLRHDDERVRAHVRGLFAIDAQRRQEYRAALEEDERQFDADDA